MSAVKLILKRSSILGKRPTTAVVEPGELAMNTNSVDPGLFMEVSDGNVIKIGPTSISPTPPTNNPELGELWFNTLRGTLSTGVNDDNQKVWESIAAPFLGGKGYVAFVAPEFPGSTDSLLNDGQALPFQTLTRALIEFSKTTVNAILAGNTPESENNRYTVYLAPSRVVANNGPGVSVSDFTVNFSSDPSAQVSTEQLTQFNPVSGGILVPQGVTIVGMDMRKCLVHPSYVPTYQNPSFPPVDAGQDQPITSILKWSGNTLLNDFSVSDKIAARNVDAVYPVSATNNNAIFRSSRPHGLSLGDAVQVDFASTVAQSTGTFVSGVYYVNPINVNTFYLSLEPLTIGSTIVYVQYSTLPVFSPNDNTKLIVTNQLYSAHRLRLVFNATFSELSDYYTKIQKAFPVFFGGKVTDGSLLVSQAETVIVAPATGGLPTNSVANSSAYANHVNLRSQYGMCWGDIDGDLVQGFKSAIVEACTAVSLQNDPTAYEIYTTLTDPTSGKTLQRWWTLTEATYLSYPSASRPASITLTPVADQLALLNSTPIPNIRFYYETLKSPDGESYGIVDINKDFRHFGFRSRNNGYVQAELVYTIGCAVGVWALNGGRISLTGSTTNFGSVAIKSEGFYGINSVGGANANNSGFLFAGVQAPLALARAQVEDIRNKKILSLGSRILSVEPDPADRTIQLVRLSSDFSPCYLLPFSLKPGSAVWVATENCTYRGFFATDGGPTVVTGQNDPNSFATLRLRASDSTIPSDALLIPQLSIPYIRRFRDPRTPSEASYSLLLRNTLPTAISPSVGQVLRLNQTGQTLGNSTLEPNVQLDPGALGGWGRVFTVNDVQPGVQGSSPQFNYVISDTVQDSSYFVTVSATDYDRPWTQGQNTPQGSYTTTKNKNWYSAENNFWDSLYYDTIFTTTVGPEKLSPVETCSPFVATSTLERQDLVSNTFQGGYAGDPLASSYPDESYFRGATTPFTEYTTRNPYDEDDSSESLGICIKTLDVGVATFLTSVIDTNAVVQTEQQPSQALNQRYRPEVVQFTVLSPADLLNPKQSVSIVRLSNNAVTGVEYMRVIGMSGKNVTAIRLNRENSFYPTTANTTLAWPVGTTITPCATDTAPVSAAYDPEWTETKRSVLRFFEVMGYPETRVAPLLFPRFWGERFIPVNFLPIAPSDGGYAAVTGEWPLQFNNPSTILASGHTWAYAGYGNYSRGLPDLQTNDFTRKLSFDFLATTLWSGALSVTGVNNNGDTVQVGPQREALTAQFFEQPVPEFQLVNQEIYEDQPIVDFPSQVVVYSVDNISSQFDGASTNFDLTVSGLLVPPEQLRTNSALVSLGAVNQLPTVAYTIVGSQIVFSTAPQAGTVCDIRVVTSEDDETTLQSYVFNVTPAFDGVNSNFTLMTSGTISDNTVVDAGNTFVFLGGVEQIPGLAYYITRVDTSTFEIIFTGTPLENTTIDVRCFTTGEYWANQGIYPVAIYSLDDIEPLFDSVRATFPLTSEGLPINPEVVNTENLFISTGGAIQLPFTAYTVVGNEVTFTSAPAMGTTSNLRILTNAEFLTCPRANGGGDTLKWGPGLVLNSSNSLVGVDSGILG